MAKHVHSDLDIDSSDEGFQLIDDDLQSNADYSFSRSKFSQPFKYFVIISIVLIVSFASASVYKHTVSSVINQDSNNSNNLKIKIKIKDLIQPTERFYFSDIDDETIEYLFKSYLEEFEKDYDENDEEYSSRFGNFKASLVLADERNAKEEANGGSAIHGITALSDLSDDEKKGLRGYSQSTSLTVDFEPIHFIPKPYKGDLVFVDWTDVYNTPVKDQGYCGSCWAFSATEQIESDARRVLGLNVELSPQQIVSCDGIDFGCDGGDTEQAFQYVSAIGGLSSSASYPYISFKDKTYTCKEREIDPVVTISRYGTLLGDVKDYTVVEERMKNYVLSTGPLSICLDASTWDSYISGIVTTCGLDIDHCVQVVGLNTETGAWKVRNSWSDLWGDNGFIWLSYGANTCGITHDPTFVYPKLASKVTDAMN